MKRPNQILSVLIAMAALAAPGFAQTVVNDTWQDATRTDPASPIYSENGLDADFDTDIESAWFGNSSSLSVSQGHLLGTTSTGSRQWTSHFATGLVTLANDGDILKITLKFTPTTLTQNANRNMRFGLFNYSGGTRLAADGSPAGAGVTGYSAFLNFSPTFGVSNPLQINERTGTASTDLQGTSADFTLLGSGGANGAPGFVSGSMYTLEYLVTRTSATSVDVSATFLDSLNAIVISATGTDASAVTSFDTFSMRPSSTATTAATFDFTLFKVEVIPEPSSFALAGLGLLALAAWRVWGRRGTCR